MLPCRIFQWYLPTNASTQKNWCYTSLHELICPIHIQYESALYIIVRTLFFSAVTLQFTEPDYARVELERFIQPQLQLSTTIGTDLTVAVIPLNLTFARNRNQLPSSLDPILMDPNFDPNTQTATGKLRSRLLSVAES